MDPIGLEHSDILPVIAEVAAAFVGFSLAIGLLQPNQPGAELRKQSMQSVAELAMISGAGALVILVLQTFVSSPDIIWRTGSGVTALLWAAMFYWATLRYSKTGTRWNRIEKVKYAGWLSVVGIGVFIVNVLVPTDYSGPIHIVGLFLALVLSGYMFLTAIFLIRPR